MRHQRPAIKLTCVLLALLACSAATLGDQESCGRYALIVMPSEGLEGTSASPEDVRMMRYLLADPMVGNFQLLQEEPGGSSEAGVAALAGEREGGGECVEFFYLFGAAEIPGQTASRGAAIGERTLRIVVTDATSVVDEAEEEEALPLLAVAEFDGGRGVQLTLSGPVSAEGAPASLVTRALRGAADANRDRKVTVSEFVEFFSRHSSLESAVDLGEAGDRELLRYLTLREFVEKFGVDGALSQAGLYGEQERWVDAYLVLKEISDEKLGDEEFRRLSELARLNLSIEIRYGRESREENVNRDTEEALDYIARMLTLANANYVEPVDNRDLFAGGLENLRLFLDNSRRRREFAPEASDEAVNAFMEFLAETKVHVYAREVLAESDFRARVRRVMMENDVTAALPDGVIATEFIYGITVALDPNSDFISATGYREFQDDTAGRFGGLGIEITLEEITLEERALTVITPLNGTPAAEAGLLPGDRILAIDGESTAGMNLSEAVWLLRGPVGTKVTLTVVHRSDPKEFEVTIQRGVIHLESVKGFEVDPRTGDWRYLIDRDSRIGYVRLTDFKEDTPQNLDEAITVLEEQGMKGLILDLRFNHGGLLTSGVKVADRFLSEGTIVTVKGGHQRAVPFKAHYFRTYAKFPMVVLVNDETASAAEILAGALKDSARATLVGTRTFGKGTVQTVYELERGKAAFKLTTAKYYMPSGISIHREPYSLEGGLEPDVAVEMSDEDSSKLRETWHLRGLQADARERLLERARKLAEGGSEFVVTDPDAFDDVQLERARDLLRATIAAQGEITDVAVY